MLSLAGICKTFYPGTPNERVALRDVDLELATGDFVTIIGSNGAGKSTLLNVTAGSLSVDSGKVRINGKDVTRSPAHRRAARIARVFQDPQAGTAPHLTIEQNLSVALNRGRRLTLGLGLTRSRRRCFVEQLATLEQGLEHRMNHRVGLLSGGQRQALSLLMATFTHPDLLLLDEHTAALDPERAELVLRLTAQMISDHQLTALMVTHNMDHALRMGNRLLMMHDGEIVRSLSPEEKAKATVSDLLDLFATKGGLSDRTLLT
ncbi:MAG: ATP-binding cassette domain-containing protein [Micrococcales bacterium]|nr:ATP-binding cassette domain-containing protein [Micrococcales bacterium]MCL2666605.1 ATP-binding cassette domain-containing protein [Micrococcales bacterium]